MRERRSYADSPFKSLVHAGNGGGPLYYGRGPMMLRTRQRYEQAGAELKRFASMQLQHLLTPQQAQAVATLPDDWLARDPDLLLRVQYLDMWSALWYWCVGWCVLQKQRDMRQGKAW